MNVDSGLWRCFTCQARGNLSMLISELTDDPADLWNIQSYVITSGLRRLTADEAVYDEDVQEEVDWIKYNQFAPLPQPIIELRNFDPTVAQRYGIRWDTVNKATTVPIVSALGELKGWQAKKEGLVRNLPHGVNKGNTLFGIERAYGDTAVLVESPLDVVRFHSVIHDTAINCLSSFGANLSVDQTRMLSRFDNVIIALDHDKAGNDETRRLRKIQAMQPRKSLKYWNYHIDDPKDIGEMTDNQILRGLSNANSVWIPSVQRKA